MVVAVLPAVVLGVYNAGLQINAAVARGAPSLDRWQSRAMELLGFELAPESLIAGLLHGGLYFLPLLVAVYFAGRVCELIFALSRREQLSEGLWPVALIFTLMLPPTTPLWQAVVAIVFGVVIGKEIFGGTGRNVVSPILLAWLFLWVAYPATLSGDRIWVAAGVEQSTALDIVVEQGGGAWTTLSWRDAWSAWAL